MTPKKEADPQYLYILPKYLEFLPSVKLPPTDGAYIDLESRDIDEDLVWLSSLTHIPRYKGIYMKPIPRDEEITDMINEEAKAKPHLSREQLQMIFYRSKAFDALRNIGLDFKGGLKEFWYTRRVRIDGSPRFPTTGIMVVDEKKARKYVDLGIKLDSTREVDRPSNINEAAKWFWEISDLVDGQDGPSKTMEELAEEIREEDDEGEIWKLKREWFRLNVRDKYEDMLIDMVEKIKEEKVVMREAYAAKCVEREKKRVREERQKKLDAKMREWSKMDASTMGHFEDDMKRALGKDRSWGEARSGAFEGCRQESLACGNERKRKADDLLLEQSKRSRDGYRKRTSLRQLWLEMQKSEEKSGLKDVWKM